MSTDQAEDAVERLRADGRRVTVPRRLLLRCLYQDASHRTAEDLAAQVHALAPDVHISTIYRNLDELERLGVVVHSHLGHGPAIYHLAAQAHGHLVCDACGTFIEAPAELFRAMTTSARARYGFQVDPRHFAVLGRCASCLAAKNAPA